MVDVIAVRVYGDGSHWTAEVVATATGGAGEWTPIERPVPAKAKKPELALLKAITAHHAQARPERRCERCGHRWRLSKRTIESGREPSRCPHCKNPWKRKAPRRDFTRARRPPASPSSNETGGTPTE